MRRVRGPAVEAVFVLAGAKRRARTGRPRAIHIYEQKGGTRVAAETTQTPLASFMRKTGPGRSSPQRVGAMFRIAAGWQALFFSLKLGFWSEV